MKGGGYEFVTAYKEPNTKLIQNKRIIMLKLRKKYIYIYLYMYICFFVS